MSQQSQPGSHWTAEDVSAILHNPVYVGMGPFPPLIDEATWIRCQERLFETEGVQPTLRAMQEVLTATLGAAPACLSGPGWLEQAAAAIARRGAVAYYRILFRDLRAELISG